MSNADTTTQSSDTKPQQLDTSGEVQPKVGDGTKGLHLDASVDNSDQPKVVHEWKNEYGDLHRIVDTGVMRIMRWEFADPPASRDNYIASSVQPAFLIEEVVRLAKAIRDQPKVVRKFGSPYNDARYRVLEDGREQVYMKGKWDICRSSMPTPIGVELARLAGELERADAAARVVQVATRELEAERDKLAERVKELEGEDWRHYVKKNVRLVTRVNRLEAENTRLQSALTATENREKVLARELGRERRSSELRHRTIEVLKTERAGLKGGIVGRDDRHKALEQRLSVEKKRIVRIRAERDKLAGELEVCRELSRDRQQRALDAEDEVGTLAERVRNLRHGIESTEDGPECICGKRSSADSCLADVLERVKGLEEAQSTAFDDGWAAHAKTTEACEVANTRLREALEVFCWHVEAITDEGANHSLHYDEGGTKGYECRMCWLQTYAKEARQALRGER